MFVRKIGIPLAGLLFCFVVATSARAALLHEQYY